MDNPIPPELLSDTSYYSAHFMDPAIWEPSVRLVGKRHGFAVRHITPGLPGSFPTFMVELDVDGAQPVASRIVVKFFGSLFGGADAFTVEKEMGHYLTHHLLPVQSPAILAEGVLTPGWQYLIFEAVSGVSFGQVRKQLSPGARTQVAEQMGRFMKALHTDTASRLQVIPITSTAMSWDGFSDFLEQQRATCFANHQHWNDLPSALVHQVQDYLLPVNELIDLSSPAHLIHADLTGDHLLGGLMPDKNTPSPGMQSTHAAGAEWESRAIIDWGDARIGNILYELVALYLDMFAAEKQLLSICLEQYGLPDFYQQDFPRKAFNMLLLHQFPIPASVFAQHSNCLTLDELAEGLFAS